ncbi:MAG: D-alanyl-D-alanine carboxypeptidase [Candidatus Azotimanducaceae bacterium]
MERRNLLKFLSIGAIAGVGGRIFWPEAERAPLNFPMPINQGDIAGRVAIEPVDMIQFPTYMSTPAPNASEILTLFRSKAIPVPEAIKEVVENGEEEVLSAYLAKMQNFESKFLDDVFLTERQYPLLLNAFRRLDRVQNLVGHGNFNVISFDDMRKFGARYPSVGQFTQDELEFLEQVFSDEVSRYGFYGEKVITKLTTRFPTKDRIKVSSTGHFLFRGEAENLYKKVKKDLDNNVVLTSGIRSIVKQTHLFLAKTIYSKGNLSKASRSLAPPGHSFHGVSDFDVGKVGFGVKNFTADFAMTDEFKKLVDLGYVSMRYPQGNLLGVRYEPWHIKVT